MMQFVMENQCIGRRHDGGIQFLGHDPVVGAAVERLEACRVANKCPADADVALVDCLLVVDAELMDFAEHFAVTPKYI